MNDLSPEDKDYIKRMAILFHAQFIIMDGVRYAVPESWKGEYGKRD